MRILQFPISSPNYPRNRKLRRFFSEYLGWEVEYILATPSSTRLRNALSDTFALLRQRGRFDVIVVGEFYSIYALVAWIYCRILRRASVLVVDGFVGIYESFVEDRLLSPPKSLKAHIYWILDRIALSVSDFYLIDTVTRAELLCNIAPKTRILTLPVGAPDWATPAPPEPLGRSDTFQLLYYGDYVPLHSVESVVEAVASLPEDTKIVMTLVGDGQTRKSVELLAMDGVHSERFEFRGPVPEHVLAEFIHRSHAVVGIFGSSAKARSVIANKVWQGLACARPVITLNTAPLSEIRPLVHQYLIATDSASPAEIATKLCELIDGQCTNFDPEIASRLNNYVDGFYDEFAKILVSALRRRSGGSV